MRNRHALLPHATIQNSFQREIPEMDPHPHRKPSDAALGRAAIECKTRLSRPDQSRPVVVVGLPRSGSTFLVHLLNCLDDLFVFGDLYALQQAQALACNGPLTKRQLDALIDFLGRRTSVGIRQRTFFEQLPMTHEDVEELCSTLRRVLQARETAWYEVVDEFLTRLALFMGKTRWGYKTPQDFHHIALLTDIFPNVRFVLIVRDPRKVMASLKFNRTEDGVPGQYHPWVYAHYWKMGTTTSLSACSHLNVPLCTVRFEDMVRAPEETAERLAAFLDTSLIEPISTSEPNSSFVSSTRRGLTPTEVWMCESICGDAMAANGYDRSSMWPRLRDLPDLSLTTLRFAAYQTVRLATDPTVRVRVRAFCRQLFTTSPGGDAGGPA